jgi:hypothetical protein
MATRLSLEEWRAVYIAAREFRALTDTLSDEKPTQFQATTVTIFIPEPGDFPNLQGTVL